MKRVIFIHGFVLYLHVVYCTFEYSCDHCGQNENVWLQCMNGLSVIKKNT